MVKVIHGVAEEGRVAIRNIRRDVIGDMREMKKDGDVGEDDEHRAEAELQKLTDEAIGRDRLPRQGQGRGDPDRLDERPEPSGAAGATSVAIIMDGNGRWATERGLPVLEGHRRGAKTMKQTVKDAVALGIRELTVYAFSTENWSRPERRGRRADGDVRRADRLRDPGAATRRACGCASSAAAAASPTGLLEQMDWAEAETAGNTRMTLFVAFNYGGRAEILDAAERYEGGGEEAFAQLLYAPEMSDPELVIRTSGEKRLSNFLLWQSAYSELLFSDVPLAGLRSWRARGGAAGVRVAPAPLRGPGVTVGLRQPSTAVASRLQGRAARCRRSAMRG